MTRGERALLAAIVAAGAALRFAGLGSQSWSPDEGVTVGLMRLGFGDLFTAVRHSESTPPLYYWLAWVWAKVFGLNEALTSNPPRKVSVIQISRHLSLLTAGAPDPDPMSTLTGMPGLAPTW